MKSTLTLCTVALSLCASAQTDQNKVVSDTERDASMTNMKTAAVPDTLPENWVKGGIVSLNLSQTSLTNWAAGGLSSASGIALFNGFANYGKGNWAWDNNLVLAYGVLAQQDVQPFKTDDRIELNSKLGRKLSDKWFGSALFQFRTQFADGFAKAGDTVPISRFAAPAYILLGLGADYKHDEHLSVFISPAMAKVTVVNDPVLADAGAFGVTPATFDGLSGARLTDGETVLFQFGAFLNMVYNRDIAKNVNFRTRLDLFSNYLDEPANIDVNWETVWTAKVKNWLGFTLNTLLIYDDDIDIAQAQDDGSVKVGPATQFRQIAGVGITVDLAGMKK
jgi:Protein of unknown function (DUF3078)